MPSTALKSTSIATSMRSTGCIAIEVTRAQIWREMPSGNAEYAPSDVNARTGLKSLPVKSNQHSILLDTPEPEIPCSVITRKGFAPNRRVRCSGRKYFTLGAYAQENRHRPEPALS